MQTKTGNIFRSLAVSDEEESDEAVASTSVTRTTTPDLLSTYEENVRALNSLGLGETKENGKNEPAAQSSPRPRSSPSPSSTVDPRFETEFHRFVYERSYPPLRSIDNVATNTPVKRSGTAPNIDSRSPSIGSQSSSAKVSSSSTVLCKIDRSRDDSPMRSSSESRMSSNHSDESQPSVTVDASESYEQRRLTAAFRLVKLAREDLIRNPEPSGELAGEGTTYATKATEIYQGRTKPNTEADTFRTAMIKTFGEYQNRNAEDCRALCAQIVNCETAYAKTKIHAYNFLSIKASTSREADSFLKKSELLVHEYFMDTAQVDTLQGLINQHRQLWPPTLAIFPKKVTRSEG